MAKGIRATLIVSSLIVLCAIGLLGYVFSYAGDSVPYTTGVYPYELVGDDYLNRDTDKGVLFDEKGETSWDGNLVPDEETAVALAEVIIKALQRQGLAQGCKLISVTRDERNENWIVSYAAFEEKNPLMGGGYSIAIRKTDARIISIWTGE